jgi:hypothetical protein
VARFANSRQQVANLDEQHKELHSNDLQRGGGATLPGLQRGKVAALL